MIGTWSVGKAPCGAYLQWAHARPGLFVSPHWAGALESLGASALYAWHGPRQVGALIAVFRRGPFRVGVLGFPVAGQDYDALLAVELNELLQPLCRSAGLDLLRVNISMRQDFEPSATSARPDAWIDDLSGWDVRASKRLRKDLAFARRANPALRLQSQARDPDGYYALYAAAVRAHGGALRYTPAYFHALARVSESTPFLRHYSALDQDGGLRGFAIMAMHGDCAYYLHGGSDNKGRREGATDLLMEAMLQDSRDCGRFNLMASPWGQSGLLRFKRKWSDREGLAVTYDIPGSPAGKVGHALLRVRARHERSKAREFFVAEEAR